jgi:hypothetical protein
MIVMAMAVMRMTMTMIMVAVVVVAVRGAHVRALGAARMTGNGALKRFVDK